MRSPFSKFLVSLVLLGSSAAPTPLDLADPPASLGEAVVSRLDFHELAGSDSSSGDVAGTAQERVHSTRGGAHVLHAAVTVPCQGCAPDGADVPHPTFSLDVKPKFEHSCAVALTLNGTSVALSKASLSDRFELGERSAVFVLQAVLDCTKTREYTVSVFVKRFGPHQVVGAYGFRVLAQPDADSLSVSTFGPTQALSAPSTYNPVTPEHDHPSSLNQTSTGSCTHCPIHSLFTQVKAVFREDSFQRFKGKVQSVVANFKHHLPCKHHSSSFPSTTAESNTAPLATDPQAGAKQDRIREFLKIQTPAAIAFEVSATALVLIGVFLFLRTRCCSLRRRVERLADREERMKAREYRRAARREAWRKRWAVFKRTFTCCFGTYECEPEDEEKRGLVVNAALEEYSDSDVPGAQMCEQLSADEMVAEIIQSRRRHNRDALFYPYAIAAGCASPRIPRSRASSLPSYDSDILPDYSWQPDVTDAERRVRFAETFRRSDSPSSSTGSSRCTPDSSVPDISPRPSQETLRTISTRVSNS